MLISFYKHLKMLLETASYSDEIMETEGRASNKTLFSTYIRSLALK